MFRSIALAGALALGACTPATLQSQPGQLFCYFQIAGGGTMIAKLVKAAAAGAGSAAPAAVLATNTGKAFVDSACAAAVASVAGATVGVPVSPPDDPAKAPTVAVKTP